MPLSWVILVLLVKPAFLHLLGGISLRALVSFILLHPFLDLASCPRPLQQISDMPSPFPVPLRRRFLPSFFAAMLKCPPQLVGGPHAPASVASMLVSVAVLLRPLMHEDPSSSLPLDRTVSFVTLTPSPLVKAPSLVVPVVAFPPAPAIVD
jgi:hypothetical protein